MSRVEINYSEVCPYLVKEKINLDPLVLDLGTDSQFHDRCDVGENLVEAEVLSDRMLNPAELNIEVKCTGCKFQKRFKGPKLVTNPDYNPTA